MPGFIRLILFIFLLCFSVEVMGQSSVDELRKQISKLENEIKLGNDLLKKTSKDRQLSQSQLKIIQTRINNQKEIVSSLEKQINLLDQDIKVKSEVVGTLSSQHKKLKEEYAMMLKASYKNYKLNNFLAFLFASQDFNDMTKRVDFMRRYNRMRESKAREISTLADSISTHVNLLDEQLSELAQTRLSHSEQLSTLGQDEKQYRSSVEKLRAQEAKISKDVKAKQAQKDKAQKSIQEIIAEEARKARNEKRTAAEDRYIAELSGKFDDNKGKLPYPVRSGIVVDRYGSHPHPTQKGMIINNKGVNIAGDRGSEVTCVFEGEVSRVFSLPGMNNCVMIRHGNYITLYANLASVAVKKGDKVSLNQRVGRLSDSSNADDVYLHFEIWKETTNLNPEQWLRR